MRRTSPVFTALAFGCTVGALAGTGWVGAAAGVVGGTPARTTVTIQAEGTDLSGLVKSPRPQLCAADRTVIVIRQRGARGGGDDERFASDSASRNGDVYQWSTGNTGTSGRFYARVRAIEGCRGDTSPTIRVQRDPGR